MNQGRALLLPRPPLPAAAEHDRDRQQGRHDHLRRKRRGAYLSAKLITKEEAMLNARDATRPSLSERRTDR